MLFPPITPYRSGFLDVGQGHRLYWDESGNPRGVPAVILHGGPGAGCGEFSRRWFDPRRYRVITFDQRGSGRSTPHAGITHNTTGHLVADLEALRASLGVECWVLFGRSWGATLALAYAERRPRRVAAMILNAIFLARPQELDWLYHGGAAHLSPGAWAEFIAPVADRDPRESIEAYHALLTCGDRAVESAAARSWCRWEDGLATVCPGAPRDADDRAARARARIGTHYFAHRAFLREGELLAHAHRLRGVPGHIIQGCNDLVTPPSTARELHHAWPESRLQLVPDAGHASGEAGIMRALMDATDALLTCDCLQRSRGLKSRATYPGLRTPIAAPRYVARAVRSARL